MLCYVPERLALDGHHVWNFGVRQRVWFDLPEPPHPWNDVSSLLEDESDRRRPFIYEVSHDSTQRTNKRYTWRTTVDDFLLCMNGL